MTRVRIYVRNSCETNANERRFGTVCRLRSPSATLSDNQKVVELAGIEPEAELGLARLSAYPCDLRANGLNTTKALQMSWATEPKGILPSPSPPAWKPADFLLHYLTGAFGGETVQRLGFWAVPFVGWC